MAEGIDEEIIIIEDSEAAQASFSHEEPPPSSDDSKEKKRKLILFGGLGGLALLIIIIVITLLFSSSESELALDMQDIDEKLQKPIIIEVEPSKLENMIVKANYLYTTGSKEDALSLYEKIAEYSEAISQYNLGVAQLKEKQYATALETFKRAINNDEKRCVSAINAAVCSLYIDDKESFKYYIDLAYAYLPNEIDSPLYSYYYTLINYYNQNYLASLNALKNSTSDEYPTTTKYLNAKINALFGNNYAALEAIEKNAEYKDDFSIALLYARVGDFTLAKKHLEEALISNTEPVKAQLALALINLKIGEVQEASKQIQNLTDMFPSEVYKHYPIKVKLKESLFETSKAQDIYREDMVLSKNFIYQKIFYFSPYKVFNANQTISYIRKGNANIYIDNIQSAQEYLKQSASSSNVNLGIAKAIKKALDLQIREANSELLSLVEVQPKHSILQYNLALTYAQLGNINKSYEHFLRSYYLDAKNYLSGIYAVMSGQLANQDITKLKSILKDAIADEEPSEEIELYSTLLNITENDYIPAAEWLSNDYSTRPLYLTLDIIIALKLKKYKRAQKSALEITRLLPNDILPHLLYIDAFYSNLENKKYALKAIEYLNNKNFYYKDLYYGPSITRYAFIQMSLITGKLYYLTQQLQKVLETSDSNTEEIESALAMAYLFNGEAEKSYTLYNHIVDELKIRDAQTLFLAAVSSIAAQHHANAIALLELSKMKDKNFYESRYALALLYMEIDNNEGATIELSRIAQSGFISKYIDFEIDTQKLLYKKQHPQN